MKTTIDDAIAELRQLNPADIDVKEAMLKSLSGALERERVSDAPLGLRSNPFYRSMW